jgi:hypothetical protein
VCAITFGGSKMRDYPAQIGERDGHCSSHRHLGRNEVVDGADAQRELDADVSSRALACIGELVRGFDSGANQPVDFKRNRRRGVESPTLVH